MTREIQLGLFGRAIDAQNPKDPPVDYRQYAYPAFADLLLWPAAVLDFPTLRLLLAIVLPLLTAFSIWLWTRTLNWRPPRLWSVTIIVLMLCTYELLEAFFAEQPGLLVSFCLSGTALALRKNRLILAGVLMSVTLIKPQVTILAVVYMLLWSLADRRRARFWIGFSSITILLIAASLWIWPDWIREWVGVLLGYHRYAMPPLTGVLLGSKLNAAFGKVLIAVVVAISAVLAWRNRRASVETSAFWLTLSLLLAVTCVAILPGQAIYDHVILIPGILLLLRDQEKLRNAGRVPRALLAAGALVVLWPWSAAFALLVTRLIAQSIFDSYGIFVLPIRTAASLPFAVLALLAYAMRISSPDGQAAV